MAEVTLDDNHGNTMVVTDDGDIIDIFLHFSSELKKPKRLGVIDKKRRVLSVKFIRGLGLNHKHIAYPLNYKLISETKKFDTVELSDEMAKWVVPVSFVVENGKCLLNKQQGFEKEIFVTLEQLNNFKLI